MSYAGEDWHPPRHSSFREHSSHFCSCWANNELRTCSSPFAGLTAHRQTESTTLSRHIWAKKCVCVCVLGCRAVSECFWAGDRRLYFNCHPLRSATLLDWLQRLCSQLQSIMGRKKIQIQRITDERNKQVCPCFLMSISLFSLLIIIVIQ